MKLGFSVLWFDDSKEYFDSLEIEPLEQEILSWGFSPRIETVTTPEDFNRHSPFDTFDLIVVDRNLEQYEDGEEFISRLRDNLIYTEVILYTAGDVSELWDAVHEKKLEGVFVANRNDIFPKISIVGRQSIRKVLDLENMRGIVMSEVGELDCMLEEIIKIGMDTLPQGKKDGIYNKFYEGSVKQNTKGL